MHNISEFIKQNITLFDSFYNIYLLGSILNANRIPNDIDILLIYSKDSNKILNVINIISSTLETISGLPVDLTVLSIEEEIDTGF
ncbi:MAG: hypothetical protein RHS_2105 [Robinsoniella sp. RHS]|nr:MAG: hypothetical protein RHS_2105 [Robinsoniella sp. RHS]